MNRPDQMQVRDIVVMWCGAVGVDVPEKACSRSFGGGGLEFGLIRLLDDDDDDDKIWKGQMK